VIDLVGCRRSEVSRALSLLLEALGATVRFVSLSETLDDDRAGAVILAEALEALDNRAAAGLLRALASRPLLVYGLGLHGATLAAINEACGAALSAQTVNEREYRFASHPVLWPFGGSILSEESERETPALKDEAAGLWPLVSTPAGVVFGQLRCGSQLFVTTVADWPHGVPSLLKERFQRTSFMDALPVLVFARHALGGAGWVRPRPHANVMIDDPNLRRPRYGFLDYRETVRRAKREPFHLTIAVIPLDYQATAASVARIFLEHRDLVSLVMHGNDHLKRELARSVSPAEADYTVRQAIVRMEAHHRRTGLSCPRVMTMPHGASTPLWLRALQEAGYVAAVTRRSYAFTDEPALAGAGPLYELLPAEMSLFGFPLLNRWSLDNPVDDLLFAAWLGKPLVVYSHHQLFADWDRLLSAVRFINSRVGPDWADLGHITRGNYLLRTAGAKAEVLAFSNDLVIHVPPGVEELTVTKEGRDIPWETEEISIEGAVIWRARRSANRIRAVVPVSPLGETLHIAFSPMLRGSGVPGWQHTRLRSRARRALTEARDRLAPAFN
jgi:hypothetical protein